MSRVILISIITWDFPRRETSLFLWRILFFFFSGTVMPQCHIIITDPLPAFFPPVCKRKKNQEPKISELHQFQSCWASSELIWKNWWEASGSWCGESSQDHLEECYDKMQRVAVEGYESVQDSASRSDTPSNVLDQHFGSTSDSERTGGMSGRALKRRRTSGSALSSCSTSVLNWLDPDWDPTKSI